MPKTGPEVRGSVSPDRRMDPLVRAALGLQHVVIRGAGLLLSLGLGVYLVCWAADPPAEAWSMGALALLVASNSSSVIKPCPFSAAYFWISAASSSSAGAAGAAAGAAACCAAIC